MTSSHQTEVSAGLYAACIIHGQSSHLARLVFNLVFYLDKKSADPVRHVGVNVLLLLQK